jgi:hypothetical protein
MAEKSMVNVDHYTSNTQITGTSTDRMVDCMQLLNERREEIPKETYFMALKAFKVEHFQVGFIMMALEYRKLWLEMELPTML